MDTRWTRLVVASAVLLVCYTLGALLDSLGGGIGHFMLIIAAISGLVILSSAKSLHAESYARKMAKRHKRELAGKAVKIEERDRTELYLNFAVGTFATLIALHVLIWGLGLGYASWAAPDWVFLPELIMQMVWLLSALVFFLIRHSGKQSDLGDTPHFHTGYRVQDDDE